MNNYNGGSNGYHHQQTAALPINHNYGNSCFTNTAQHSLDGSVTDVKSIKSLMIDTMGFSNSSIIVLTEVESKNIITALRWLVQSCEPGESLVFYYTWHGSRVADDGDDEYDGYDEALCPLDYKTAGKLLSPHRKKVCFMY